MNIREPAIGLDFGTSNSGAAIYDGEKLVLLPVDKYSNNSQIVKSVLYITRDHKPYIGDQAIEMYVKQNIGRPRHFVKVWVGEIEYRGADTHYVRDVYVYVDEYLPGRLIQYLKTVLRNPHFSGTTIFGKYYDKEDLIATYLEILRSRIENQLGKRITRAVFGRPVKFAANPEDDNQAEHYLKNAAVKAGFTDVRFELEPVAVALKYESSLTTPENILVFDFGGGTLDITIIRVGDKKGGKLFATGGVDIAGSLFDEAIIRAKFLKHFGYGLTYGSEHYPIPKELIESVSNWPSLASLGTAETKSLLDKAILTSEVPCRIENLRSLIFNEYGYSFYSEVESAKIMLSSELCSEVNINEEGISIWQMLTRSQFENIIQSYEDSIETCLTDTLNKSNLNTKQIDRIVTTGGSSSIPAFQRMLSRIFGSEKLVSTDIFTSVTAGLAIKAHGVFQT